MNTNMVYGALIAIVLLYVKTNNKVKDILWLIMILVLAAYVWQTTCM